MSSVLRISEAATIGFHALVIFASSGGRHHSTREVAESLEVSEWHLSKVLQRLARAGIIRSVRGPGGGYMLSRKSSGVTLLDILEAIDGPFDPEDCLMHSPRCKSSECILGDLLADVNRKVRIFLEEKSLADFEDSEFAREERK